ncbi:P-loop containing nucleoside triphosphate hydrolase protein [Fusarium venenatum]|uniref:P-loop containing nucleoside triphosphate hydrolase protein n=1 Tax=Fusarium venenatum TaxID=56646 RepID=UPI001D77BE30|nr:P-loop containing nucleoside triphosphate hydrolase protein [Fusarium venenatum]
MSQWSKRRRLDQGEEQVQRNGPQHPTTWSQSDAQLQRLPAAIAQQHYEWNSHGNVQTSWNDYSGNTIPVHNVMNYHMGSWNGYSSYPQNTIGIEPSFSYPNDIITQWPSYSNVPLHSHALLQIHMPLQTHASMFVPSYQQYPLYGSPTNQPTAGFQQSSEPLVEDTLPKSLPYHADLSQSTTICVDSPSALPDQEVEVGEIVCFGMIPSIAAKCDHGGTAQSLLASFPVGLESSTRFSSKDLSNISGQIPLEYSQMIQDILDETCLELHASCIVGGFHSADAQSPRGSTIPSNLEISVYGPVEIFEELGKWFDHYQVYLQDPRECHRDVRYCNPHRLSTDEISGCPLLSDVISQSSKSLELESVAQQSDLLDELCSYENLDEAPQPSVIKRELKRHQKQALTFMIRREQGWAFSGQDPDIWEVRYTNQGRHFLNRVSDASQVQEPPQCYGGIVADPMGLGKTLTMIALVATDMNNQNLNDNSGEEFHQTVPTTLIVVPPSLIGTWEEQLSAHVMEDGLTCHLYHQKAHIIRNVNSRMSQAICALDSRSRWAVTGTPVQNRLGDLASLFKFIRVHPYTDRRCFDADISRLWKNGEYQEAIKRLKRLSKCLILRRDKSTINLPPRQDLQCPVNFSPEEQALYDNLREDTKVSINEAMNRDSNSLRPGGYVHILQRIESLRLICNIGLHYHTRHDKVIKNITGADEWMETAQTAFNMQREMVSMTCLRCSSVLDITETVSDSTTTASQNPLFFSCLTFVCAECVQRSGQNVDCGHNGGCAVARISMSGESLNASFSDMQPQTNISLPSKVKALITDISNLPSSEKCVVFSTWRRTLDIIEAGLTQSSILSVRFDGTVPQKSRQNVVDKFRTDPSIRIMLLTLSCGAAGLTLTEATRAYLMEPHWNPTTEEQALARIHRIGQKQEVTTVRFFMRDSFEHRVIQMQEDKKHLAGLLLSPDEDGYETENLGRLQSLSSLL